MFFLKMSQGKFIFKRLLMENGIYKSWLKPGTTAYTSKCSVCVSEFNVAWDVSLQSEVMNMLVHMPET